MKAKKESSKKNSSRLDECMSSYWGRVIDHYIVRRFAFYYDVHLNAFSLLSHTISSKVETYIVVYKCIFVVIPVPFWIIITNWMGSSLNRLGLAQFFLLFVRLCQGTKTLFASLRFYNHFLSYPLLQSYQKVWSKKISKRYFPTCIYLLITDQVKKRKISDVLCIYKISMDSAIEQYMLHFQFFQVLIATVDQMEKTCNKIKLYKQVK